MRGRTTDSQEACMADFIAEKRNVDSSWVAETFTKYVLKVVLFKLNSLFLGRTWHLLKCIVNVTCVFDMLSFIKRLNVLCPGFIRSVL